MAALMAARRGGMTAVRRWRPRRLHLELGRASMNYGEPSAQDFTASGGREWRGHDDGVSSGAPGELARGAVAYRALVASMGGCSGLLG